MRWKLSSHKSLAPGVDPIFWAVHGLILLGLTLWVATSWSDIVSTHKVGSVAIACLVLMGAALVLTRLPKPRFALAFWPVFALDLVTIGFSIWADGGASSNHYLLFFALIPFVGYNKGLKTGMLLASGVTIAYLLLCLPGAGVAAVPSLLFRCSMLALFTAAMGFSADHIRRSEQRLLNAE